MVNNSTNEQSPPTLTCWTQKRPRHDIGNPGPGLWQAQKCDRVKMVNVISTPPFLISESPNGNTYINKDRNPVQIHFHSKRPHTITKNERQSKLGQYNNRVNEY